MPKLPFYRNHPRFNCLNPRGDNGQEELYEYEYDNAGRPAKTYHTHNKGERILLSESVYDDLGRLQEKRRHNDMDTVRYEYNIRNWVSAIKSRSFVQRLYYDTGSGSGFVPRYNGNIAGIGYEQNGHSYNYLFLYDGLDRLTVANPYDKAGGNIPYSELYEYDRMGNITCLERQLGENKADALNIQYTGNQIKKVSSGSPALGYDFGSMSYPDLSDASIEYYYDNNGNLIKNLDKGVVATRHNFLNLPDTIQFQNGNQIINSYLADGRKVKAIYKTYSTGIVVPQDAVYHGNASYSTSTDEWDGHYMYRSWYGDTPRMFMVQTPEGYVGADYVGIDSHRNYAYYYYVHDHLGNVRITRNSQGYYADQSLEYYPSGVLFDRSTEKERQPYMFGGKELVSMHGLNEYDFTGRWQYSIIPSFTSLDPLCEKYYSVSPYVYCHNNPINRIDFTGKWDVNIHLYNNRSQYGYGVAIVTDRNNKKIYRFTVRAEGVKGKERSRTGADTPLGTYDIPDNQPWLTGGSRASYGPNARLNMNGESGEIATSGRSSIRIHGGRQETYNEKTGKWVAMSKPQLKKTYGCLRAYDADMKTFQEITNSLEATDELEIPGKVVIEDDLEQELVPSENNSVGFDIKYKVPQEELDYWSMIANKLIESLNTNW